MSVFKDKVNKLLLRIKNSDERSKSELFNFTYNHLKIVACKHLKNKSNADDAVTDAFMKLFKNIGSFDKDKDGYNWMCKIVQNCAYDINKKMPDYENIEENFIETADSINIDDLISDRFEISQYLKPYGVNDLKLIQLKIFEDMSFSEIAEKLGSKKSTLHKRLNKLFDEILLKSRRKCD